MTGQQKKDLNLIRKTIVLKKKGLSNVEIGRVIRKNEKQVRRYLAYAVSLSDSIPTLPIAPSDSMQ